MEVDEITKKDARYFAQFFKLKVMWFFRRKCFQIVEFSKEGKQVNIKDIIRDKSFVVEKKDVWCIYYLKDSARRFSTCTGQTLRQVFENYKKQLVEDDVYTHCENVLDLQRGQITEYLVDNRGCHDTLFAQYEKQYTHL